MAFYNTLEKHGNRVAFISEESQMTYSQIVETAKCFGQIMPPKSLVVHFCENSIGSCMGYLCFLNCKGVPILLNSQMDRELAIQLIDTYQPDYLYVPHSMLSQFENEEVCYEGYGYALIKSKFNYKHVLHEDLALLLTTSGSTGSPKLVRQSFENITSNSESIAEYLKLSQNERPITTLPMNYTYGLSIINSHVLVGATILLTERTMVEREFWNFFKLNEATSFGGVPYTYELLKKLRFMRMTLPSLKTMTQAGGKLSPQLHKEFAEYALQHDIEFIVMYGQTEATARMGYLPHEKSLEKFGSLGVAIPGGKLVLVDEEGALIQKNDVAGELIYEGPNVTLGYAEKPCDLEKGDERHGVLETGDMAYRDSDGYFYIVGRKKRFLKILGNRVNLDEVEMMVREHYPGLECACGGVDDGLMIYIALSDEVTCNAIRGFVSEKTGLHASTISAVRVDEIPKSDSGKIQYAKLESTKLLGESE